MILLYYYISIIIVIIAIIIILLGLNWIIGKWFGCVWKLNNGAGYCIDSGKEQTSICWNVENLVMSVWLRFFFYWKVAFLDFSFHSIPFGFVATIGEENDDDRRLEHSPVETPPPPPLTNERKEKKPKQFPKMKNEGRRRRRRIPAGNDCHLIGYSWMMLLCCCWIVTAAAGAAGAAAVAAAGAVFQDFIMSCWHAPGWCPFH